MKKQNASEGRIHAGIALGTVAVLVLLGGGAAWAQKQGDKIQLKKDNPAVQEPQEPQAMDPFRDLLRLQQEMDRLFGSTLSPYSGFPRFDAMWDVQQLQPAMDLSERADAYIVKMELPGLDKSDISIEVKDNVLTVAAKHKESSEKKDEKTLIQERSLKAFRREVMLPGGVAAEQVAAEYKDGVLTITVPKTGKDKDAHRIEIK